MREPGISSGLRTLRRAAPQPGSVRSQWRCPCRPKLIRSNPSFTMPYAKASSDKLALNDPEIVDYVARHVV